MKKIFLLLLILIIVAFTLMGCNPIKIISAERTHMVTRPDITGFKSWQYTPLNPEEDVILVLEIGGISAEEFEKVKSDKLYLKLDEQQLGFDFSRVDTMEGEKEKILLVAAVPKQVLEFKLFIGDYSPITFKVEEEIHDELEL